MRIFLTVLTLTLLSACTSGTSDAIQPAFSLDETELPGVFEVTAQGMNPNVGYTFVCEDGVTGEPTLIDNLWLAARDRVEVETRCALKGKTSEGMALGTSQKSLRRGMLEAQAAALDPLGDSGLDRWEKRSLGDRLNEDLPQGIDYLAWRDERRRLVLQNASGQTIWTRRWSTDGLRLERVENPGTDPCANQPSCAQRLMGFFENPQAPDLIAVPFSTASFGQVLAHSYAADSLQNPASFLAWGAGVNSDATDERVDAVDLAPTLAAALGLGWTVGRDTDGALAWVPLKRVDGRIRSDLIASQKSEQVLVLVIDGLSAAQLEDTIQASLGFKRVSEQGLWLQAGLVSGFPGLSQSSHNTLGSGLWSGHHGIHHNRIYDRQDNAVTNLVDPSTSRLARALIRTHAETLHQALADRPNEGIESPWSVTAGSPSQIGATTHAFERTGPGGEGWLNIGREAAFAELPQAPDWLDSGLYESWETSIILAEYTQRMITGLQVPGARPTYTITRLGIYHDIASVYGTQSEEAQQALLAVDTMIDRLIAAMERREWENTITIVITGGFSLSDVDPQTQLEEWWHDGSPWADQGIVARSIAGHITIEAMAFDKRIDNGFVHLTVRDADTQRGLGGVTLTTYTADGDELGTRLSNGDGVIDLPQPNDRNIWGVLRADGYSDLRLNASELQL